LAIPTAKTFGWSSSARADASLFDADLRTVLWLHALRGYVAEILKGIPPGDLPAEEAREFKLIVNLKTAKELGITIPPSVFARADMMIE